MEVAVCLFTFIIAARATLLYLLYVNEQKLAEAALVKESNIVFGGNSFPQLSDNDIKHILLYTN